MKQFVVIGLGRFGFHLAVELTKSGYDVIAIDNDKIIVEEIKDLVHTAIIGDASDKDMLAECLATPVDAAILGLGETYLEATVLAIFHLKNLGIKNIIVKSLNELRGKVYLSVGATEIIYPEKETALRLAKRLTIPMLVDQISLSPEYSIVEIALPDSFVGKSLRDLKLREKYGVNIIAVKDILKDHMSLVPKPDMIMIPDTALVIIGKYSDIDSLRRFF